tara:strand:- start:33 stop:251 length:219 start_codon:yes stop_codon:yes gene_type:complete
MDTKKTLDLIIIYLDTLSESEDERNELYKFISQNLDQFFEINERMVREVKNIKDKYPKKWKEMVAMTMFSTL